MRHAGGQATDGCQLLLLHHGFLQIDIFGYIPGYFDCTGHVVIIKNGVGRNRIIDFITVFIEVDVGCLEGLVVI